MTTPRFGQLPLRVEAPDSDPSGRYRALVSTQAMQPDEHNRALQLFDRLIAKVQPPLSDEEQFLAWQVWRNCWLLRDLDVLQASIGERRRELVASPEPCGLCAGDGRIDDIPCPRCGGSGKSRQTLAAEKARS
jgi:hypothetical protein